MRTTHASRPLAIAAVTAGVVLFAASPSIAGADRVRGEEPLTAYSVAAGGKPELVPDGAEARVQAVYNAAGDSIITLHVTGLLPDHTYGAHAHVNPCGLTGGAAGPHYQLTPDPDATPTKPSTDPGYANPGNEVWLDVTTNAAGNGASLAKQAWQFPPGKAPRSVIIHEKRTATGAHGDGPAGTAGARLACVDVSF